MEKRRDYHRKKNVSVLSCQDNRMCDTKLAIRSGVVVG